MEADQNHLDLLGILHYVMAGFTALGASIPVVHLLIGIKMLTDPGFLPPGGGSSSPFNPGWIFVGVSLVLILTGWTVAALLVLSGISLRQRRRYWLCFVMACLACINFPMGTALGVFTLIVLLRPSVKQLFGVGS